MNRRIALLTGLLLVLLLAALPVLAGCGDDETTTDTTEAAETTDTSDATEETTETSEADAAAASGETYNIGITQIVSHPALDAVAQGFKDALEEEGIQANFDEQNAQGELPVASTIAEKFVADNVDLILAIATPTSQAAVQATDEIPVLFAAVTDPVAAGLVDDPENPTANVTGVSDKLPMQPHLDLVQELVPDIQTLGVIYNAGEANSVALVEEERQLAEEMGWEVQEATVASSAEVLSAAQSLIGRVDAISVLTDNTVVSAFESVVKVGQENGIPVIAGDIDSVERGAAAAYAFDYYEHGRQAGRMAARWLTGTPIDQLPVEFAQDLVLAVNPASAEQMGITIPDAMQQEAGEVF